MTNKKWDYTSEIRKPIKKGTLILSEPFMQDEFFQRSVCFICSHTRNDGTFGFIVNKPIGKSIGEIVPDFDFLDMEVFYGGPVGADSLHFLHTNIPEIEGSVDVGNGLYWNGNFEQVKIMLKNKSISPENIRFFLGYSGWEVKQLRTEIINNAWIICNDYNEPILSSDKTLWNSVLSNMDDVYKEMSNFPKNPNLN